MPAAGRSSRNFYRDLSSASLALLALLFAFPPGAKGADEDGGPRPLFENQDTLQVRIEAPLTTLMRERSDTEYLDGTLAYTDPSGQQHLLDLKLRARGKYRAQRRICDLPPVRLNFKKKQVLGTEFAGQDKLKLVTHCESGRGMYEQYVLKEYLAYKIFNAMTDMSFRARLLRVDWVNSERDGETDTRYAFLIEDDDLLAERIRGTRLEVPNVQYSQLDARHAALVSVFEYLIGNTDFSLVVGAKDEDCCHNAVLFSKESEGYLTIPYDFDFSGLVDASYASPNPKLPIKRVTRRLYRGVCEHTDELGPVLASFREQQPVILGLVSSLEGLEIKVREKAEAFINGFYRDVADEESVDRYIVRKCQS
jgi:hypothetical protein